MTPTKHPLSNPTNAPPRTHKALTLSRSVYECKPLAPGNSYGFLFGYIIPWHADAAPASLEFHDVAKWGRGLHSFRFQLNLSSSVHRVTQHNS